MSARSASHRWCTCTLVAVLQIFSALIQSVSAEGVDNVIVENPPIFSADRRTIVTNQAMGARCAVSADFDGDGRLDLVSASSNDNAVSWYKNLGPPYDADTNTTSLYPTFSIKNKITWSSRGSRIATVGDVDGDGDVDVVGVSYDDSSLRWFENDGTGTFTDHLISNTVFEGQGVTLADLDNDGDPDIACASSFDNTIAVFKNIDQGTFCEIKEVVDANAGGARTVIAADLNGDGWLDLASASKDDDSVSWYPNDGTGHFPTKVLISAGDESKGAYSLVAVDIDKDGDQDLAVASNGNDHVSIWRNDGSGNFEKTLVYDNANFVLSVTAVDFDRDGDVDIASASFYDGHINWYENIDGKGYVWKNHTIYVGIQGHYVYYGDMDGDGDDDLIAVDHAENSVTIFFASTVCDADKDSGHSADCCHEGSEWNGTACDLCSHGTYGIGFGVNASCVECPIDECSIPGQNTLPPTCSGMTRCINAEESLVSCICPVDTVLDRNTATCTSCSTGQVRPDIDEQRGLDTLGYYAAWEAQQGTCVDESNKVAIIVGCVLAGVVALLAMMFLIYRHNKDEVLRTTALQLKKRENELEELKASMDKEFSLGASKYGDAVEYIDTLLDQADENATEQLDLIKNCLVRRNDDNRMHIPTNLITTENAYIMHEFAGVNSYIGKSRGSRNMNYRSSTRNLTDIKRATTCHNTSPKAVRTVECLHEFTKLDNSKQMKLFELLSFTNLQRWDFNVFDVAAIDEENTLLFVAWAVIYSPHSQVAMAKELRQAEGEEKALDLNDFDGYDFLNLDLAVDNEKLCNYFRLIQADYQNVPYHNRVHAADVVQTLNSLIQMTGGRIPFDREDLFLLLFASVVHDVKHPGRNNSFQVKTFSDLSLDWNDVSVLENEHVSHAFKLMIRRQDAHFLPSDQSKLGEIRTKVIDAVLHTDMTKHFATVARIKSTATDKSWEELSPDARWEILMYMLHLADISNPAKGDPMFKVWTDRCLDEFFAQGDKERNVGLPISPNCDRETTKKPDSQIGFINFVVKPAYEVLADVIPGVNEIVLPVIESNLLYWNEQKEMEETV